MKKYLFSLFIVLLFSFFAIKPLFTSGFFPMHDDTQVQRVYEMWSSLKDGMFPVRWVSDLGYGYGYPIYNFYGPLAYYIGGIFVFVTQNALVATKLMFAVGILLAGVSMYTFANALWGKYAGITAALLYMYTPYHALNIYVRGDVAEFFAYAFLPFVFYGIYAYIHSQKKNALIIGSIGYAGLILSHNLSAMMLTPFIGIFLLYSLLRAGKKNWRSTMWVFAIPVIGVALSAFYWLPALGEMHYTNVMSQIGGGSDFRDHFVCLSQLWSSPWGYGGSIPGCVDGLSFQIGKLQILFFILGVVMCLWKKRWEGIMLTVLGFFSIFLLLPYSRFIWESVKLMAFFQFPWRFLMPTNFFFSALGGLGIGLLLEQYIKKEVFSWVVVIVLSCGISVYSIKFFVPQTIYPRTVSDYTNMKFLKWDTSKISDEYMPPKFTKPTKPSQVVTQKMISTMKYPLTTSMLTANYQGYFITTQGYDLLHFNTAYFPGWHLFINGKEKTYKVTPTGMEYSIDSPGKYVIDVKYQQTLLEKVANLISVIGVLMIGIGIIKRIPHEKKN